MEGYSAKVKSHMLRFYRSLNERDRRRYAAVEAIKLGHGGIEFISKLLNCDQKTITSGIREIRHQEKLSTERQRKKGADVNL
ncbi:MAG: hypothetical protein JAY75_19680 [Candidatus Thiodiazotropha taylori]|nr:hypothetical protein [Candidatus Thiodiazotropha taylori]MCG8078447.1 hypothetical protein [Candidatus Thiodiazotropha taylori]MCW4297572.1 hypothetical protein [Candidatus Thiodiazotropha endolucinida]MCW4310441.1 hypothetical protein [Candidatus Thiodiazotropha endolucinida]MCW4343778.1 hypothetical protein [Candidatus Thiodiazotropha endolucinida]